MGSFTLKGTITYAIYRQILVQFVNLVSTIGDIVRYGNEVIKNILKGNVNTKALIEQCARFGVSSLPITLSIVGMSSIIVAMQVAGEMVKQGAGNYVGLLVAMLIIREDGIIMSGFAIISMIGSSLASEVATMRVTEQIDALKTLSTNPFKYIVSPRVLAGILVMPLLVLIADIIGIFGGFLVSVNELGFNPYTYIKDTYDTLKTIDVIVGITKGATFGAIITSLGCYYGYYTEGGAEGVGKSTTNAVVISSILILISNYILTALFFN